MLDLRAISQSPKRGDRQDRRDRERVFDEPRLPLRCAMTRRRAPQRVGDEATLLAPFVLSSHAIKWPWLRLSAGSDPREARTARPLARLDPLVSPIARGRLGAFGGRDC